MRGRRLRQHNWGESFSPSKCQQAIVVARLPRTHRLFFQEERWKERPIICYFAPLLAHTAVMKSDGHNVDHLVSERISTTSNLDALLTTHGPYLRVLADNDWPTRKIAAGRYEGRTWKRCGPVSWHGISRKCGATCHLRLW